ncbi:shTK domain protein, partial [Ancylostoma duodenale]
MDKLAAHQKLCLVDDAMGTPQMRNHATMANASEETTTQPGSATEEDCFNEDQCCGPWAARGECSRNPSYMLSSCKASCGVCTPKTYDLNK